MRHISVSVNTQRVWKHYWILIAMENAISYESVKVDPKLKIYDLQDHERAQKHMETWCTWNGFGCQS